MKQFIITFTDTIEAETEQEALEFMLNWIDYEKDNSSQMILI